MTSTTAPPHAGPPLPSATPPEPPATPPDQPPPPATTPASDAPAPPLSALPDPLAALNSMWTGWMAPAPSAEDVSQTLPNSSFNPTAASTANEWLQGAGKMWESAVNDVGSKLKEAADGVDTASLGQHVNVIRQKSVGFVEDVSRNFQNINLNMNQSELSKRAEVISNSTKNLLDQASQTLQKSHQEALHIFVDADSSTSPPIPKPSVSPWDKAALPPSEHQYADNLRQEMLKIVVDSIYSKKKRIALFLSDVANANNFKFNFDENSGMALAALDADTNMRRLRAGLVPGKMTEDAFWTVYFYHVHRVRQALVANNGVIPEPPVDEDDEDPAALFGNDDEEEELAALDSVAPANASSEQTFTNVKPSADGKRNWDDEIDAIFDDE